MWYGLYGAVIGEAGDFIARLPFGEKVLSAVGSDRTPGSPVTIEPVTMGTHRTDRHDDGGYTVSTEITAESLGIDMKSGEQALFKWLLASFLFGKRIQQNIAADAFRVIVDKHGRDTPRKLCNCSWQDLVNMLGEGRYVRYDESTADRLLKLSSALNAQYGGKVLGIREQSEDRTAFEKRLQAFEGIGPKTVEIFMREAGPVLYPQN